MIRRCKVATTGAVAVVAILVLALGSPGVPASQAASNTAEATCDIGFSASSTLHDFSGTAPPVPATLHESSAAGHWDVDVVVPVASLNTDESARDKRMREMFQAERWPEIRAALRNIDPVVARQTSRLDASLTIRDVTHGVVANLSNWQQDDAHVSFDAGVDVSLRDFNLEAPTVFGLIRVADNVRVKAHVVVATAGATALLPPSLPAGTPLALVEREDPSGSEGSPR